MRICFVILASVVVVRATTLSRAEHEAPGPPPPRTTPEPPPPKRAQAFIHALVAAEEATDADDVRLEIALDVLAALTKVSTSSDENDREPVREFGDWEALAESLPELLDHHVVGTIVAEFAAMSDKLKRSIGWEAPGAVFSKSTAEIMTSLDGGTDEAHADVARAVVAKLRVELEVVRHLAEEHGRTQEAVAETDRDAHSALSELSDLVASLGKPRSSSENSSSSRRPTQESLIARFVPPGQADAVRERLNNRDTVGCADDSIGSEMDSPQDLGVLRTRVASKEVESEEGLVVVLAELIREASGRQ